METMIYEDLALVVAECAIGAGAYFAWLRVRSDAERAPYLAAILAVPPILALVSTLSFILFWRNLSFNVPEIVLTLDIMLAAGAVWVVAVHRIPLESRTLRETLASQRETNELLDEILENTPAGILRIDSEGTIQYGNRELLRITGEHGNRELLHITGAPTGKAFPHLAASDKPAATDEELETSFARALKGEPFGPFVRDVQIGPRTVTVEATGIPIRTANGGNSKVTSVLFFIRDITNEREAANSVEHARAQMLHCERLATVGALMANVAHEINNPLQSMILALDANQKVLRDVESGSSPLSMKEAVEKLRNGQALAQRGVNAVAQLSKSIKGVARPGGMDRKEVDANAIASGVVSLVRARLKHTVEVVTELNAKRHVSVNEAEIAQVLLNLAINAGEAMESSNGPRRLTLRTTDRQDGVLVEVADTGPGIPPEVAAKLYTPFFTTKPEGTGLGLCISRRLIEQHGSRLLLVTEPGEGTTFSFTLPLAPSSGGPSQSGPLMEHGRP
ncbi:MAG: ATP-binding protein [Candidatus Thermoplasmatota archaeon]